MVVSAPPTCERLGVDVDADGLVMQVVGARDRVPVLVAPFFDTGQTLLKCARVGSGGERPRQPVASSGPPSTAAPPTAASSTIVLMCRRAYRSPRRARGLVSCNAGSPLLRILVPLHEGCDQLHPGALRVGERCR